MDTEEAARRLRDRGLRATPQRRAILQIFRGASDEHLSAEEVLARASTVVPGLGRGTVYATLAELAELGLLTAVGAQDVIRYETNVDEHDHFRCRLCLRIFDVDLGGSRLLDARLDGFTIEDVVVEARGVCSSCTAYEQGLADGAREIGQRSLIGADGVPGLVAEMVGTPIGEVGVAATEGGIARVAFTEHADFPRIRELAGRPEAGPSAQSHLDGLRAALGAYFDGSDAAIESLVDWRLASDEAASALAAVRQIPYAEPRSYVALGADIDPYACGHAMGANPIALLLPCHRVTRGQERPEIYVGGTERLRFLHDLEQRVASR